MVAKTMPTPVGYMPIRKNVILEMQNMSDRKIADHVFDGVFIDPEYYAELLHRKLSGPGMRQADT